MQTILHSIKRAAPALSALVVFASVARAEIVKSPVSSHPFGRGNAWVAHSSNPEGWVRGFAELNTDTKMVRITLQFESDSTTAGPKGTEQVLLKDAGGHVLTTINVAEAGIGGKAPGRAVIKSLHYEVAVPAEIAAKVRSIDGSVACTGSTIAPFGYNVKDIIEAAKVVVTIIKS